VALETRWPFLDERVLRFGLALPPFPWCVDKYLLRCSLRGRLPTAITTRPKSPLAGDPLESFIAREPGWPASALAGTDLGGRLDPAAWQRIWDAPLREGDLWQRWQRAWPLALAQWLRRGTARSQPFPARMPSEVKSPIAALPRFAEVSP
jgi:asparagine synthase (glutamine-hydrolysing)